MIYQGRIKSQWREFEFMAHQVQQAVEPELSLKNTFNQWGKIGRSLAEASRKRKPQMDIGNL